MKKAFDQITFSELLKKAIGSRKQKDFAGLVGISSAHLSRIINRRFDTPPSIDTLKKIATYAENGVTYQDLLETCGYIGDSESNIDFSLPPENAPSNKFVKATILTALESRGFSWELINEPEDSQYDLTIRIRPEEHLRWHFKFLSQKNEDQIRKQFSNNYLKLIFQKINVTDKLSFVTCSQKEFDMYVEQLPISLNVNLSIILVDESQLDIQKEYWLSKATLSENAIEQLLLSQ